MFVFCIFFPLILQFKEKVDMKNMQRRRCGQCHVLLSVCLFALLLVEEDRKEEVKSKEKVKIFFTMLISKQADCL